VKIGLFLAMELVLMDESYGQGSAIPIVHSGKSSLVCSSLHWYVGSSLGEMLLLMNSLQLFYASKLLLI
jgi:hypothetical protein